MPDFPKIASLRRIEEFQRHLETIGVHLPVPGDPEVRALAAPISVPSTDGATVSCANRFAIHPMEGWDGTTDGFPSALTERRWRNFGKSGASLLWGGEAVAVCPEGRANPNQLLIDDRTASQIGALRSAAYEEAKRIGVNPVIGLQLTHSGRWARPTGSSAPGIAKGTPAPRVAFQHPILDARVGIENDDAILSDPEIDRLIEQFARAAYLAGEEGFDFVDIKHCHGYLLHEFLGARARDGRWGGPTLAHRTALLHAMIAAVRDAAPRVAIGVRLSAFDLVPHAAGPTDDGLPGPGEPVQTKLPYLSGFGMDLEAPDRPDLSEPLALVRELVAKNVLLINVTGGSPYYCPHAQRPAAFPPSDGYAPPEDPLRGVARLLQTARAVKQAAPEAIVVSSGWTYLQDYLPAVAEGCLRERWFDFVGLGRMVLSYPELPADVLAGRKLARKRVCRTFSDCTTAPRKGLLSGCYPLDAHYRQLPDYSTLESIKRARGQR